MNLASNSQGGVQLGLWESIMDLLMIKPVFFLGIFVVIVLLLILGKNKSAVSKVRIILVSFILYYCRLLRITRASGSNTCGRSGRS